MTQTVYGRKGRVLFHHFHQSGLGREAAKAAAAIHRASVKAADAVLTAETTTWR